ncbi:hypothetical protein MKW92_052465 [Papaver armeniacum]|nr:hypothetical protein MKW92_052465 [Papaver armeniacum]
MNFAHGGTGVFNILVDEPNMTTRINTFKQYIADGVYGKRDLEKSIAVVALSGISSIYCESLGSIGGKSKRNWNIGIKKVVMLTLQPLGCLPNKAIFLFYEKCNEPWNNYTIFHNMLLQQIVQRLNSETTDSPFHIHDLYSALMSVIINQGEEGSTKTGSPQFGNPLLKPCCVGTSTINTCGIDYDNGVKQYTLCENPDDNIFWDSYHSSQSGWQEVSSALKPAFEELMLSTSVATS